MVHESSKKERVGIGTRIYGQEQLQAFDQKKVKVADQFGNNLPTNTKILRSILSEASYVCNQLGAARHSLGI